VKPVAVLVSLVVLVLAGVGVGVFFLADSDSGSASGPPPTTLPGPPVSPNPLTGDARPAGKILAVKIDNVGTAVQARQQGLNSADLVYAIQVEGGLSRLMAVYDSNHVPPTTGPVRSARQTDIPILAAYGHVNFAYSGAITGLTKDLANADLTNITPLNAGALFSNGGMDPTFVKPADIFAKFPDAVAGPDIGLRFAAAPAQPSGGTAAESATVRMPSASFGFQWDGAKYLVSVDGRPAVTDGGQRDTTTNVIVQHVDVVPGKYTDHNAGHADNEVFSVTTGNGTADVYRNGLVYHATWSKPTDTSPTTFAHDGAQMTLQPGRTWIVLAP
jgi:hypothetical protein